MRLVVIGGSAGSIEALRLLLAQVPPTIDAAIVIVVHVTPRLPSLLVSVLGAYTTMPVIEALDKAPLKPGHVFVAPPDYHLLVERDFHLALSRDPTVHFSRPAIDVLFDSAADAGGAKTIGVLLTGGNEDGASGLGRIQAHGGLVAVQDPATSVSPEMPMSGLTTTKPDRVAEPRALGQWLATLLAPPAHR
jgi:two-component system chemotaxis response regulator CheB